MEVLLAGPGTGKTTNIKQIINHHGDGQKFLILSFTNATVSDLLISLESFNVTEKNCMTLHKFAIMYNHDDSRHILLPKEEDILKKIASSKDVNIIFHKLCDFLKCTTFDQIINRIIKYAKSNPLYFKEILSSYDALIIDEYQDFNPLEQEILDILIDNIGKTYLLGDDDQCIYDFKDSSSDRIIEIYNDTDNRKIEHEHKCYRCADKIVEHATNLILENQKRVPKKWEKSGKIGDITYLQLNTIDDVADSIVSTLKTLDNSKKILLLTPVKNIIDPIIKKFQFNNIQFTNCFKDKPPEHILQKAWEVRLLFGNFKYLNLILFGYNSLKNRKKFYQCVKQGYDLGENYEQLFALLKKNLPDFMLNISFLDDLLSQDRYQDILELYQPTEGRSSEDKLEKMLNNRREQEESNIQIMSIHKSKGLQAEYVFMVGLNEGIIPNVTKGNDSIEYQRRLFYVGMTRAKTNLFLFSNIYTEGKYVFTIDKSKFSYEPRKELWRGRASTFISDLKLN